MGIVLEINSVVICSWLIIDWRTFPIKSNDHGHTIIYLSIYFEIYLFIFGIFYIYLSNEYVWSNKQAENRDDWKLPSNILSLLVVKYYQTN